MDVEISPQEPIDYWLQTKAYFSIVRHMNNTSLNPKTDFTNPKVNESDLVKVFGPKCS